MLCGLHQQASGPLAVRALPRQWGDASMSGAQPRVLARDCVHHIVDRARRLHEPLTALRSAAGAEGAPARGRAHAGRGHGRRAAAAARRSRRNGGAAAARCGPRLGLRGAAGALARRARRRPGHHRAARPARADRQGAPALPHANPAVQWQGEQIHGLMSPTGVGSPPEQAS